MQSAISKLTKTGNINVSTRIREFLHWRSDDEILEQAVDGKVILTNLTMENYKQGDHESINGQLEELFRTSTTRYLFITQRNLESNSYYPARRPHTVMAYFIQQFKGMFNEGQIKISESLLNYLYPNQEYPNDARGNQEYRHFINEGLRFYNSKGTQDSLVIFEYDLFTSYLKPTDKALEAIHELKSALMDETKKVVFLGHRNILEFTEMESLKKTIHELTKVNIEDYLIFNTHNLNIHETIESKPYRNPIVLEV
ncbi:hypothetical protein [Lysinibacillus sp. 38-6]|uniref:hypothetical protein n=1 Tax=Lysinibacillus sp. 38-6 TaxID=3385991 RepID=UPI0039088F99